MLQAKNQILTEKNRGYKQLIVRLREQVESSENDVEHRRLQCRDLECTLLELMKRKKLKCACENNVLNCQNDTCVKLEFVRLANIKRESSESD